MTTVGDVIEPRSTLVLPFLCRNKAFSTSLAPQFADEEDGSGLYLSGTAFISKTFVEILLVCFGIPFNQPPIIEFVPENSLGGIRRLLCRCKICFQVCWKK